MTKSFPLKNIVPKAANVIYVAIAVIKCRKSQPDSSNGIFAVRITAEKERQAVYILLAIIIRNNASVPMRGTNKHIVPRRSAESERLRKRSVVCLPSPLSMPEDIESKNIMGVSKAIILTEREICGAE